MVDTARAPVLAEAIWDAEGAQLLAKRVLLVVLGVAIHIVAAKIQVPVWPSPVPVTMGSFAVLTLGAAYGPRLGLVTILAYLALGVAGWDVFAGTSAEVNGLGYMLGGSGGYLVGWLLATLALGWAARRGWDRSVRGMAIAMLAGSALIYVPGLLWLHHLVTSGFYDAASFGSAWEQTLAWGLAPYLIGDAVKLALAALLVPGLWKIVGRARI